MWCSSGESTSMYRMIAIILVSAAAPAIQSPSALRQSFIGVFLIAELGTFAGAALLVRVNRGMCTLCFASSLRRVDGLFLCVSSMRWATGGGDDFPRALLLHFET